MLNNHYNTLKNEYTVWLTTLGFSNGVVLDYKDRVRDFFEWLQTKSIHQINLVTQKHIETYFEYLQVHHIKY
jgi:site-specific recombinase XerD